MIRQLWCNLFGHAWFPTTITPVQKLLSVQRTYRCRRCKKWKGVEFKS